MEVTGLTTVAVGVGLTVIVKVLAVPVQDSPALVKVGVTVIVAVIGFAVVLVATKDAIFPVPLDANPIEGVLLDQLKLVPIIELLKLIAVVLLPLQTV
jgi:hypothetical protein